MGSRRRAQMQGQSTETRCFLPQRLHAECPLWRVGQASQPCPGRPSALQGSWADACMVKREQGHPAPCPARPFLGALAASLCSRQPSGPPASPAQPLPDVRHGLPRERPAGPGRLHRGLWDPGAPASSSLLSAPSPSDGYRATGSESQFSTFFVHPILLGLKGWPPADGGLPAAWGSGRSPDEPGSPAP